MEKLNYVEITIPGKIPTVTFQSKSVNRKTGKIYSRPEANAARMHFESWIVKKAIDLEYLGKDCQLEPPYSVTIAYNYKATKKVAKKMDELAISLYPKTTKPDIDNLGKMILDVLTEVGFLKDDSMIYSYRTTKMYSTDPEKVFIIIESDAEDWE